MSKLVRDRIPEIIEASGNKPIFHIADDEEFKVALKDKLIEEAVEFNRANTDSEILEELIDIIEVIGTICERYGIDIDKAKEALLRKNKSRGAFDRGIILDYVLHNHDK